MLLGVVGSLVPLDLRIALASLLALLAIILGGVELSGHRIKLIQCSSETPQLWLNQGPLQWAARNGLVLGCGATRRLGFWLWYTIPAGAFLIANPVLSMVIYGTYGIVRGAAVWVLLALARRHDPDFGDWLVRHWETARLITAGQLLLLGITVTIAVGL